MIHTGCFFLVPAGRRCFRVGKVHEDAVLSLHTSFKWVNEPTGGHVTAKLYNI